jgi:hypothetical protein
MTVIRAGSSTTQDSAPVRSYNRSGQRRRNRAPGQGRGLSFGLSSSPTSKSSARYDPPQVLRFRRLCIRVHAVPSSYGSRGCRFESCRAATPSPEIPGSTLPSLKEFADTRDDLGGCRIARCCSMLLMTAARGGGTRRGAAPHECAFRLCDFPTPLSTRSARTGRKGTSGWLPRCTILLCR